jgi:hypothetical protein
MSKIQITEYNCATGEEIVREATLEEIAQFKIDKANFEAKAKAESDAAIAKAALLERLGITAEEAALLLG